MSRQSPPSLKGDFQQYCRGDPCGRPARAQDPLLQNPLAPVTKTSNIPFCHPMGHLSFPHPRSCAKQFNPLESSLHGRETVHQARRLGSYRFAAGHGSLVFFPHSPLAHVRRDRCGDSFAGQDSEEIPAESGP